MTPSRVLLCGVLAAAGPALAVAAAPAPADKSTPATKPVARAAARPATRAAPATQGSLPSPTLADVPYGKHPKQVLHFWKATPAAAGKPTPLLVFIHGGGWTAGNRFSGLAAVLPAMLANGVSVVSVEYRFVNEATADGVVPPVKGPLSDAARAVQFVRSKAAEWNLDKTKVAASGGSAGACTSLWLAFHDDLADPKSSDPIARESTRLLTAAVSAPQTTLDPQQMKEWTPNSKYGGHAFGFKPDAEKKLSQFDAFLAGRETVRPWIAEYSPYALVTPDDPPVYMIFATPPALGKEEKDPTHTANFGVKLQEHMKAAGVGCEVMYPGAADAANKADAPHKSMVDYLLAALKK
jgi:acetyl esterase/lipase